MRPPIARQRAAQRLSGSALGLFLGLVLSGCGAAPRETFTLPGPAAPLVSHSLPIKSGSRFAINEPSAVQPVASDRIVVRTGPGQVELLAGAQWSDRLPRLVQARLIAAFQRGGVPASAPGAIVDLQLASEIRRFEIDVTRQAAVVEIAARVLGDSTGTERAARIFVGEAPAPGTSDGQAARALDEAMNDVDRQIVAWARSRS